MVGYNVDIDIDRSRVDLLLINLTLRLQASGLESFMRTVAVPWLQRRAAQRFGSEGDDATGHWTPLRKATEAFRARGGFQPAHPINVRTLAMFDFITNANGNVTGGPGYSSLNWPGASGRTSDLAKKIRTAQGLTQGIVARPVLGLSPRDDIFISSRLLVHLTS